MKAFEYAAPRQESDVLELLSAAPGHTEILAGGTDLIGLMKKRVLTPARLVNIKQVAEYRGVSADSSGLVIGAVTTLEELLDAPELAPYAAIRQAIVGINSPMLQAQGTLGGELCRRPRCWFFRNGHGLLADQGRLAEQGENRYHAILGNQGPAKFVHASRLAPALMALGARMRVAGPAVGDETIVPVEDLFQIPSLETERENTLGPNQVLTHIHLPPLGERTSATYEVRHGAGAEPPLASAAVALRLDGWIVREANIVLGHVAPIPWRADAAVEALVGQPLSIDAAQRAGEAAVAGATPLRENGYKVRLASISVERAVRLAAGWPSGGF
jgi:xanthine dehydrogenase YagS FAD-binding subunit